MGGRLEGGGKKVDCGSERVLAIEKRAREIHRSLSGSMGCERDRTVFSLPTSGFSFDLSVVDKVIH
jgi:hypothetical protein